jgi:hypothetical protein
VIENSGPTDARVTLTLIGRGGEVSAPSIDRLTVGSDRMAVLDLSTAVGHRPITVLVTAAGGTVVAGSASYSLGGNGYASTLGEAVPTAPTGPGR